MDVRGQINFLKNLSGIKSGGRSSLSFANVRGAVGRKGKYWHFTRWFIISCDKKY